MKTGLLKQIKKTRIGFLNWKTEIEYLPVKILGFGAKYPTCIDHGFVMPAYQELLVEMEDGEKIETNSLQVFTKEE